MMSDYEEDLDDFPLHAAANSSERAESVVGAYRAESTDQWAAVELRQQFHHLSMV